MKQDVEKNRRLKVFTGGNDLPEDHPLAKVDPKTGENYNTMFRAVHDIFGHLSGDNDFSQLGEEGAWKTHRQTLNDEAVPAMTNETRSQTSSFFKNNNTFPEQKATIPPDFAMTDKPEAEGTPKASMETARMSDAVVLQMSLVDHKRQPAKGVALRAKKVLRCGQQQVHSFYGNCSDERR